MSYSPATPPPFSKLMRPRLQDSVDRERVISCLDEARERRRVFYVIGPPGQRRQDSMP